MKRRMKQVIENGRIIWRVTDGGSEVPCARCGDIQKAKKNGQKTSVIEAEENKTNAVTAEGEIK